MSSVGIFRLHFLIWHCGLQFCAKDVFGLIVLVSRCRLFFLNWRCGLQINASVLDLIFLVWRSGLQFCTLEDSSFIFLIWRCGLEFHMCGLSGFIVFVSCCGLCFALRRCGFQDARTRRVVAIGDVAVVLACVYIAIEQVLNVTDWAAAFARNGFSEGQLGVKIDKIRAMGGGVVAVPVERPSVEQLSLCFPQRRKIVPAIIWRGVDAKACCAKAVGGATSSSSPAIVPAALADTAPIAHRTRARKKTPPPPSA